MQIVCAWCKKVTGKKEGEGISHTICRDCSIKYFDIDPMEKKPIMKNPKKNPVVTTWHGIHKGMSAYWIIVDNEKFGPFTTKVEAEKEAELFKEVIKENPIKFGSNSKKNQKDHVVKEFTTDVKNKWKSISYGSCFMWLSNIGFNEEKADTFAGLDWHIVPINVQRALVDSYMSYWKKYKKNPKSKFIEGERVILPENKEEGWSKEEGEILYDEGNGMYIILVDKKYRTKNDDGRREVHQDNIQKKNPLTVKAKEAVSKKIKILMKEGYPQKQAIAIAMDMARKAGFKMPKR